MVVLVMGLCKSAVMSGECPGLGFCKCRGDQVRSALSRRVSSNGDEIFLVEFR